MAWGLHQFRSATSWKSERDKPKGNGEFSIPSIALETEADVPGIDSSEFREIAGKAKQNCPVSKLLDTEITLKAKLKT